MAKERVEMNRPLRGVDAAIGAVYVWGMGEAYSDRYGSGVEAIAVVDWKVRARLEAAGVKPPEAVSLKYDIERHGRKYMVREIGGRNEVFIADNLRDVALAVREAAVSRYVPGLEAAMVRYVPADRMVALMAGGGI